MEGAEAGYRVWMGVDMIEIALPKVTSVRPLNFIPEYMESIGLGMVAGKSPNVH